VFDYQLLFSNQNMIDNQAQHLLFFLRCW